MTPYTGAKLIKILRYAYGIPPHLLRALEATHTGTKTWVVTPDGPTDEFELLVRVLQGVTLVPFLLITVLDYAIRKDTDGHKSLAS